MLNSLKPGAEITKPPSDGKSDHTVSDDSGCNNDDVPPVNASGDSGEQNGNGATSPASETPAGPASQTGTKILPEIQGNRRKYHYLKSTSYIYGIQLFGRLYQTMTLEDPTTKLLIQLPNLPSTTVQKS